MLNTDTKRHTGTTSNILIGPTIYSYVIYESSKNSFRLNQFAEIVNPVVFLRLSPEQAHEALWPRKVVSHFKISNPAGLPPHIAASYEVE